MIKKKYFILLGLTIQIIINAQQVIATSGSSMTNNSTQANWTIGETIIISSSNNNTVTTSGLNQPILKIETSVEKIKNKIIISIFPNPTSQFVSIKYDGQLPIIARILTINGEMLSTTELKDPTTQFDFSNNTNGVYIIEITDKSGLSNIYKIIKH